MARSSSTATTATVLGRRRRTSWSASPSSAATGRRRRPRLELYAIYVRAALVGHGARPALSDAVGDRAAYLVGAGGQPAGDRRSTSVRASGCDGDRRAPRGPRTCGWSGPGKHDVRSTSPTRRSTSPRPAVHAARERELVRRDELGLGGAPVRRGLGAAARPPVPAGQRPVAGAERRSTPACSPTGGSETLLSLEGDDHSRIRRLLMPAFRNKTIAAMRPRFQALANELIDGFADARRGRVHQRVRRAVRRPDHLPAARPARGQLAPGRALGRRPRARRSPSTSATRCRGSRRRSTGCTGTSTRSSPTAGPTRATTW